MSLASRSDSPDYVIKLHDPRASALGSTVVGAAWLQDDGDTIRIKFRPGMSISTENASLTLEPWSPGAKKQRAERPALESTFRR